MESKRRKESVPTLNLTLCDRNRCYWVEFWLAFFSFSYRHSRQLWMIVQFSSWNCQTRVNRKLKDCLFCWEFLSYFDVLVYFNRINLQVCCFQFLTKICRVTPTLHKSSFAQIFTLSTKTSKDTKQHNTSWRMKDIHTPHPVAVHLKSA